jgi:hypothetical protein
MNSLQLPHSAFCAFHCGLQRGHRDHWLAMARTAKGQGDMDHLIPVYLSFARNANHIAIRNLKEAKK